MCVWNGRAQRDKLKTSCMNMLQRAIRQRVSALSAVRGQWLACYDLSLPNDMLSFPKTQYLSSSCDTLPARWLQMPITQEETHRPTGKPDLYLQQGVPSGEFFAIREVGEWSNRIYSSGGFDLWRAGGNEPCGAWQLCPSTWKKTAGIKQINRWTIPKLPGKPAQQGRLACHGQPLLSICELTCKPTPGPGRRAGATERRHHRHPVTPFPWPFW